MNKRNFGLVHVGIAMGLASLLTAGACGGSSSSDTPSGGGGGGSDAGGGTGGDATTGGGGGGGGSDASSSGDGSLPAPPPPPPGGTNFTITFPDTTVAPGVEKTQCVVKKVGNTAAIHVGAIHDQLGPASHHMIVYRVSDTTEQTTPFDCKPFTDTLDPTKGSTLVVSQKKDDTLQLPQGVGYTLDPNQLVRLEVHYINPGASPVTLTAQTTLTTIADADYKDEAGFLFIGDPDIKIPANSKYTLGPVFFPIPADVAGVNFFAITGHEHQFGTDVKVSTATSSSDPGTPIYDVPNWLWSEPATVQFPQPFSIAQGGGFKFECDWNNTSNAEVDFGESANNEMCFFWAYYYPSKGSRVCFHSNQSGGTYDICCPGSQYCGFIAGQ